MGKGSSAPAYPTPPSAQEIAAANAETAEHLARLTRAMEFGEELLKSTREEDGSSVRYERVATDIPTGFEPIYSEDIVKSSGPKSVRYQQEGARSDKPQDWTVVEVDDAGNLKGSIRYKVQIHGKADTWETIPAGTHWSEAEGVDFPHNWEGTQPLQTKMRSLTGYENTTGDFLTANQYYRIETSPNGETTRKVVERDEAIDVDFTGMGDIDRAVMRWEWEKEYGAEQAEFLLDFADEYGDEFVVKARDLLEKSDPTGFAARELLGQLAQDYAPGQLPDLPTLEKSVDPDLLERAGVAPYLQEIGLGDVPEYERAGAFGDLERLGAAPTLEELTRAEAPGLERAAEMDALRRAEAAPEFGQIGVGPEFERAGELGALERAEAAPTLERLTDIPEVPLDEESMAARGFAEEQLLRRAQSGETSRLMGEEARRLARGRAAGLGNIFGGGAVIEEAAAVRQAEDAGQRAAISDLLNFYGSGQTAGDYQSRIAQQNLANRMMGIQQRTGAETAEFGMGMQRLGIDREASLQERADELGAIGQRTAAEQQEYQNLMSQVEQQNMARERGFQSDIQAAGFDNEAALRERTDQLTAIGQRTAAEQQEFSNLTQIVGQINQTRGGQFGLGAQAAEFDTSQRLRERADELSAMAQRNQAEEGEYQSLLAALSQQGATRQAQYGQELQGIQQRNVASEADLARQQQAMAQRNQAAQQSFASAMQKTMSEEQLKQQQMANLQSFSGLAPVSAQFGNIQGAQQGVASSYQPIQYQPTNTMQLLQGQQNLASNTFGTQANIFGSQVQQSMAPTGFERIAGAVKDWGAAVGGSAAGFSGCHVARLVFGEDNPEWVAFYLWKETKAPSMFRKLYNKYSEQVAEWLKGKPRLQAVIRNWMRRKIICL
jgi:hypothetical protein